MGYTVIIAEKPSVAKDIAWVLAKQQGGRATWDGVAGYRMPNNDWVTYTGGHALELAVPEVYLECNTHAVNAFDYLPVLPEQFVRLPRKLPPPAWSNVGEEDPQFGFITKELVIADRIINACDKGREGQLIFDTVLIACGIDPTAGHIWRASIVDQINPQAIAEGFRTITPNGQANWQNARMSAQCRQEADWLFGMNLSRAYQALLEHKNIAMGRVKNVVLAIIAGRQKAIDSFIPVARFRPVVTMADGSEMTWRGRIGCEGKNGFDHEGNIINRAICQSIVDRINSGLQGRVIRAVSHRASKPPPLPFNKATLEIEGSLRFGARLNEISEAAQKLYDKKLISYVRTDCQYMPESVLQGAREIIADLSPAYRALMSGANSARHPSSVSDKMIADNEHHGIMPTGNLPPKDLTELERGVMDMVAHRFAIQFYPNYECQVNGFDAVFGDDVFSSTREVVPIHFGWTSAYQPAPNDEIANEMEFDINLQLNELIERVDDIEVV